MKNSNTLYYFFYKHTELFVTFAAVVISIIAYLYFSAKGLTLVFGDSLGHLNIARRVFDSPTNGMSQLGGYWLPTFQVFMLPTIWIDYFWRTGFSGSLISMISYVLIVIFIYKLTNLITKKKLPSVFAALIIMLNPNLIFMQSAPMTETLFIATLVISIYYFYKWLLYLEISDMILSGFFILLTSLTRYEGWAAVVGSSGLLLFEWIKSKGSVKWEQAFIFFSILAWYGIMLWVLWGLVLFHDPLEFLHNELSSGNQTKLQYLHNGFLEPTGYHNILEAILTNILAATHTVGLAVILLGMIGGINLIGNNYKNFFNIKILSLFLLLTPFLINIITVYAGSVPVEVAELSNVPAPGNIFNIRYSLFLLPAMALFIALISKKKTIMAILAIIILVNYSVLFFDDGGKFYIFRDTGASNSASLNNKNGFSQSVTWFKKNYNGGLIIASTGGNDVFMHEAGFHLNNYIVEGSYKIWDKALNNPAKYAKWVIISKSNYLDAVYNHINKKRLYANFAVVYQNNTFIILKSKQYLAYH